MILCSHSYFRTFRAMQFTVNPENARSGSANGYTKGKSKRRDPLQQQQREWGGGGEEEEEEQQLKRGNDWRIVRDREDNFAHKSQTSWPRGERDREKRRGEGCWKGKGIREGG